LRRSTPRSRARARARTSSASPDAPRAQREGFRITDEALRCGGGAAGTTALTALLLGRTLHTANAGDCRAVLCRRGRCIELTADHKPTGAAEHERIVAAGGFVDSEGYLNGVVGVSRALGDWGLTSPCAATRGEASRLKPGPLSGAPDVTSTQLTVEDEFLLIACDGLWDVMSSATAVELARQLLRQHNDPGRLAAELVREALARHSADNVTVLCVALAPQPPPARTVVPRCPSSARFFSRCFSVESLADVQRLLNGGAGAGAEPADPADSPATSPLSPAAAERLAALAR